MSDKPVILNEDDLDAVSGGVGATPADRMASQIQELLAQIGPMDQMSPEQNKAVQERVQSILTSGGEQDLSSTASFLARSMVEFAQEQRQQALDDRLGARESAQTALLNQADEMRAAADQMTSGAINNLVMSVVMGAASIGQVSSGLQGAAGLKQAMSDGSEFGKTAQGVGEHQISGMELAQAKDMGQAEAKTHETTGMQQTQDLQQRMTDAIKDIQSKMSELEQSRMETISRITRNI